MSKLIFWLFPVLLTAHNIEEGIWLPEWKGSSTFIKVKLNKKVFRFFLFLLTVLAVMSTFLFTKNEKDVFTYMYFGYIGAMIINSLFPHITLTIASKEYTPGVVTAAFNLIIFIILVWFGIRKGILSFSELFYSTIAVGLFLLLVIAAMTITDKILYKK